MSSALFQDFLIQQKLPVSYLNTAKRYFNVLIDDVLQRCKQQKPVVISINGSQGSGKSTLAAYLDVVTTQRHQLNVVNLSLDDFYLSHQARQSLALNVHPLLQTRGVPGTHDIALALKTLAALKQAQHSVVRVPRFNKATDNPVDEQAWDRVSTPLDVIIFEGWCIGAQPQTETELEEPINALEAQQDNTGSWRHYYNEQLAHSYPELFDQSDVSVMLQAPSFDCVYQWRLEQEEKLRTSSQAHTNDTEQNPDRTMNASDIRHFVSHFQRITEHMLKTLPAQVHHVYQLNDRREIIDETHRGSVDI